MGEKKDSIVSCTIAAEQRRKSVEAMFTSVQSEMDVAGKVFDLFMSKLNDIRTAMNMDLNRNG